MFGELLKKKRKEKKMTQADLAKKANVTVQTICSIEKGKKPSYLIVCRLATALNDEELKEEYERTN